MNDCGLSLQQLKKVDDWHFLLTLPMLRLLSSKAQGCNDYRKPSKPCHTGIHWIALVENSQIGTHLTGFQVFFRFFIFYWQFWPVSGRIEIISDLMHMWVTLWAVSAQHARPLDQGSAPADILTLMLLVANSANTKCCKKLENDLNLLHSFESSQSEISNEYQHERV